VPTLPGYVEGVSGTARPSGPAGPREETPWEKRGQLGFLAGFTRTWSAVMFRPQLFWPTVLPQGRWMDALGFAWIIAIIQRLFSSALEPLSYGLSRQWVGALGPVLARLDPQLRDRMETALEEALAEPTPARIVGGFFGYVLFFPVMMLAGAAVLHLVCLVFGSARNGFMATFRAFGYAFAPTLFMWIPCINVVAGLYFVLQLIFAVQSLQQTSQGKATAIVLTPALAGCCCCVPLMSLGGMVGTLVQRMVGS